MDIKFDYNPLGFDKEKNQWIPNWTFENMKWADIIVANNIPNYGAQYLARVCGKAREFGKFFHYDTDDLLTNLYDGHRLKNVYEKQGLSQITKFVYQHSHLVTVTQKKFAERIQEFCSVNSVLAVIHNAIDYSLPCWNVPKQPPFKKNLVRVGWAGGIHHEEDVKEFAGVPHLVNQRVGKENVTWNFYGAPPPETKEPWQHDVWKNYTNTLMKGFKGARNWGVFPALPADQYGQMFAYMDIGIAPLQFNDFNDSKSNIKISELGRYKVPLIASDVGCYNEIIKNGVTGYLLPPKANSMEWAKVLIKVIKNPKHRIQMGENLHKITEECFDLNKVCKLRIDLYDEVYSKWLKDKNENN